MTPDRSRDDKAARAINLVGFSLVFVAAVAGFVYFAWRGGHLVRDVLSLLVVTVLVGLIGYASQRSRGRPSPR